VNHGKSGDPERAGDSLAVLGLPPGSAREEIRIAYRRLAMRYHPDSSGDPSTSRQFSRIVKAYKLLTVAGESIGGGTGSGGRGGGREPPPLESELRRRYRRVLDAGDDLFALGQIVASDPEEGARAAAATRLGLSGRTAAYVFLRRAFYDTSEAVIVAAVRAVAMLGSQQAGPEIAALYARSPVRLRSEILEVAAATRERLFRNTIAAARSDPERELSSLARRLALPEPTR